MSWHASEQPEHCPGSRWTVAQIGARQHYAVPRAFQAQSQLRRLYTGAWCRWSPLFRHGPKPARAFAGRYDPDLPIDRVVAFTLPTLGAHLRDWCHAVPRTTEEIYAEFARKGSWFAKRVNQHLRSQPIHPETDRFFGYGAECLETLQLLQDRGVVTIVDQVDPARVEEEMVLEEVRRWPGWEKVTGRIPEAYYNRLSDEWRTASLVLVNSRWSRDALIRQGVPERKIIVVPLAYEARRARRSLPKPVDQPLTVLWLGSVLLRKGIPYLIQAARDLADAPIRFIVAGPIGISREAVATAPRNVSFVGHVTRQSCAELYRQADVFVLPTLSDGFGITQIEAMAQALPVITTPNCGDVVTHGVDGYVVPIRDGAALAEAIHRLHQDRGLLWEMSLQAVAKAGRFSLQSYADQVETAVMATDKVTG